MDFKEKLDSLVKVMVEFSDPDRINIEWYESVKYWQEYQWSMVMNHTFKEGEEVYIEKGVETLKASVIDLTDPKSLERFRAAGSNPTYHNIGLWRLKEFIDGGNYTHIFIYGIGELDSRQMEEFKEWLEEKAKRTLRSVD